MALAFTGTGQGVQGCGLAMGRVCMPMAFSLTVETHPSLVPVLSLRCGAVGMARSSLPCSRPPGKPTGGCCLLPWDAALPPPAAAAPLPAVQEHAAHSVPTRLRLKTSSSSPSGALGSLESSSQTTALSGTCSLCGVACGPRQL